MTAEQRRKYDRDHYARKQAEKRARRIGLLADWMIPVKDALDAMDEIASLDERLEQGVNSVIRKRSEVP